MKIDSGTYQTQELIERGVLQIGDGYRAKNTELSTSGIPFARAGNINDGFKFEGADMFPIQDLGKVGNKKSRWFDSVFTSKGSVGRIAYVNEETQEFVYSPQLCFWRSLDHGTIDPRFLNFWMNGYEFKNQVDYLKGQTDMADYVSLRDQRKMTITIPDIETQKIVAKVLGDLGDKIELNRQINQTLEQIAQAIFKSWFVDFEPVRAKIAAKQALSSSLYSGCPAPHLSDRTDMRPNPLPADLSQREREEIVERAAIRAISGKADEELDQLSPGQFQQLSAMAALFPDELEDSELGEIPKGWKQKRIDEILELAYGKALKSTDRIEGPVPVYGSGGVTGHHDKSLVNGPGIVVGRKGTVGSLHWEDVDFFPIDTVFYVVSKLPLTFCFYLLQTLSLDRMNTDAAVPGLNRNNVYRLPVIIDQKIAETFDRFVKPLRDHMHINNQQSQILAGIRDSLFPKLLSGELSVTQAEQVIEDAACA